MTTPLLLERDLELASLNAALERARAGEGAVVALEGPPGIGKSRLVRAATDAAAAEGMRVLSARGGELERGFAHGVVRQLFERALATAPPERREQLTAGPARLAAEALGLAETPPAAGGPATDPAFAVLHGLYWLVVNLAADQPVFIAIDDAHWADVPSLRFLAYLARRLEGLPVLVLVAVRSGDPGGDEPALVDLLADPATDRVVPQALTATAAADLLAAALEGRADATFADACHAITRGNPLLLSQLVDAVRADGLEPTAETAGRLDGFGPRTIARSILLRLGPLPDAAHALARAAAVLGADAELRDAAAVAELSIADAAEAADALRRVELLAPTATLDFVHPIVRTAVYEDMPAADRAAAHARAAAALETAGAPRGVIAQHLLAAPPSGSPAVVAALREAADQALREAAPEIAANLLRRALDEPPADDQRPDVLAELGGAELRAEQQAAADAHLAASVELTTDPRTRALRRLTLSRARNAVSGQRAAVAVLDAAIEDAESIGDGELQMRLEAELGAVAILDRESAPRALARLHNHGELAGDTLGERLVLANLARQAYFTGRHADLVADLAERALGGGRLVQEASAEAITVHHAALVLTLADRLDQADVAAEAALDDSRRRGSAIGVASALFSQALISARRGDLAAAEADARASMGVMAAHAVYAVLPLALLIHALIERNAFDEADAMLADYGALGPLPDLLTSSRLQHARGALRLAQGRPDAALADLEEVAAREAVLGLSDVEVAWRATAALARHMSGETDAALRLAEDHLERSRAWGAPTAVGSALTVLAQVSPDDAALPLLREAVEVLATGPARLHEARALVELGALLRRTDGREEAREVLKHGLDAARRCHAVALADRAHEELVAAGARPRRLSFSGSEALTASERRVATLAAEGRGNRAIAEELFVTIKTVENHLGRAYSKLGINSRDQLAAALREPEPVA